MSWLSKLFRPRWPKRDHSDRRDLWQQGRVLHGTRGWQVEKLSRSAPSPWK